MKPTSNAKKTGWLFAFWQFFIAGIILVLAHFERQITGGKYANTVLEMIGGIFLIMSVLVFLIAVVSFKQFITPNPVPRDEAKLVTNGIYAFIRHPMYLFGILITLGYSLYNSAYFTLILCFLFIIFFVYKIRFEEKHLMEKFPEYTSYRTITKKLIPFIY
jgi:protein-S-isoprenylcysteine O-methyltransferase Ste14